MNDLNQITVGISDDDINEICLYENFFEEEDHAEWLMTADKDEIQGWIDSIRKDEQA